MVSGLPGLNIVCVPLMPFLKWRVVNSILLQMQYCPVMLLGIMVWCVTQPLWILLGWLVLAQMVICQRPGQGILIIVFGLPVLLVRTAAELVLFVKSMCKPWKVDPRLCPEAK